MDYIDVNASNGAFVGLMSGKGLESYYKNYGFNNRPDDAPGMYLVINNEDT